MTVMMTKKEAVFHLAIIAERGGCGVDEVTALQMGARNLTKRLFEACRNRARRAERNRVVAAAGEPPAPPEAAVMVERVRAVVARMRELSAKATAENLRFGPGAMMLWLEGFASRLDQAIGDDPTPWTPYEGPLKMFKVPRREELKGSEDSESSDSSDLSPVQPFNLSTAKGGEE